MISARIVCCQVLALRPQNITQKLEVEIIGLQQKPELNGAIAEIFDYQDEIRRDLYRQTPSPAWQRTRESAIVASSPSPYDNPDTLEPPKPQNN
eukprot:1044077-Amphidinium_carterae.1